MDRGLPAAILARTTAGDSDFEDTPTWTKRLIPGA